MYLVIHWHFQGDILRWYQSSGRLCNFDEFKHFPWNEKSFELDNKPMSDPRKQFTADEKTSHQREIRKIYPRNWTVKYHPTEFFTTTTIPCWRCFGDGAVEVWQVPKELKQVQHTEGYRRHHRYLIIFSRSKEYKNGSQVLQQAVSPRNEQGVQKILFPIESTISMYLGQKEDPIGIS